ncbi:50S ribosomal protein L6 [Candidatus Pacearchaeota archaeon]|nr:50S ribosomal protein L6 [Candidatus Pacearchaeota archaeon]
MKSEITEKIGIPEGIHCSYKDNLFTCKKNSIELSRKISLPGIPVRIEDNSIIFHSYKANKNERKIINSYTKHIKNLFQGLDEKYTYKLEACNVHFPMSVKIEGDIISVSNFLGEKIPRYAKILPNVDVQIKGAIITVTSNDKEAAGQTAANIEKVAHVRNRDRRVFQDGIYITQKPERKK